MTQNCQYEGGCEIRACFNFPNETKGVMCAQHKTDEMKDVMHKKCEYEGGCEKRPHFNFKGEKKGKFCKSHADLSKMVDISKRSCIYPECEVRPSYNVEGEKRGLYCVKHANLETMSDVVNKKCAYPNCKIQPNYNYAGLKTGLYCYDHRPSTDMIKVTDKKCEDDKCFKKATFNYIGEKSARMCFEHSLPNMFYLECKRCEEPDCLIRAGFNYVGESTPRFCARHKLTLMQDIINRRCKTELCGVIACKKHFEGYCFRCFIHTFPEKPIAKSYRFKEYDTVKFVLENFPNLTWITDKKVQGGCSSRRPDMLLDLGYQVLIVEIDENQHTGYDCSCENKRLMQLSQDVGHRPMVFIRFNPDSYLKNGKTITSCWILDKKGLCTVKKSKRPEWFDRLNSLKEQIEYWINPENSSDKTVEVVQLFYDQ